MLNSYQDGCPINESHVFYLATNTFRNPIFEPQIEAELEDVRLARTSAVHGSSISLVQHQHSPTSPKEGDSLDSSMEKAEEAAAAAAAAAAAVARKQEPLRSLQKSCSNSASFSSNQSELGQRWQDFCDNLSLSIRGRLFVMESNFKRRLRAMRKYLDKKMPWFLPLVGKHQNQREDKQPGKGSTKSASNLGRFNFPEPSSARALDAQQECLLNRLERIKRQRLFRLPSESLDMDDSLGRDQDESTSIEYIDHSASSSADFQRAPQAAAELRSAPVLLEERTEPPGLFSSISHSAQAAKSKTSGKRSRWISRSGRHIRDTALAFTSSKKSCIVCYERASNIMTLPCKHSDICSDCFIEIIYMAVKHKQYPLRCVLCRQKVERIRCSRRLLLSVIEKNRSR